MKPVHMLSWPCGTIERPFFSAKICLPKTQLLRQALHLAQIDAQAGGALVGELHVLRQLVEVDQLDQFRQVAALVQLLDLGLPVGVLDLAGP